MKKILLPVLMLAFAAGCGDSDPTSPTAATVAPQATGPSFHVATDTTDHRELPPVVTGPTGLPMTSGTVTLAWSKPVSIGSNIERYRYEVTHVGAAGRRLVLTDTKAARDAQGNIISSFSIPAPELTEQGIYEFRVRGERGDVGGKGDRTLHAPLWASRAFPLIPAGPTDKAAPVVDCVVPNQTQWWGANQDVVCTATDVGTDATGLKNAADASFTLSTSVVAGQANETATTGSRTVVDNAGNSVVVGPYTFKIDLAAPTYECAKAPTTWSKDDVELTCTGSDVGAGLASTMFTVKTQVEAGTETNNASTLPTQIEDLVGNHTTVAAITNILVDKKAPSTNCATVDLSIWYGANQNVACTAAEGGSGLAVAEEANFTLSTTVGPNTELATAETGTKNVADAVGNVATAVAIKPFKIDLKAPLLACRTASFLLNQSSATVTADVTDAGSGTATPTVSASVSTATPGSTQSVTLTAQDNVQNTGTQACGFAVTYAKSAFLEPIPADADYLSRAFKAGSTLPVKFQLKDANGAFVRTAVATIAFAKVSSTTSGDTPEAFTAPADAGNQFRYSVDGEQYIFNLGTSKSQIGTYRITATLDDGTTISQCVVLK